MPDPVISGSDVIIQRTAKEKTATGFSVLDISNATEITWKLYSSPDDSTSAVISKTKSGSDITFVNSGTDGQYKSNLTAANSDSLLGTYWERAVFTIASKTYKSVWEQLEITA